MPEADLEPEVGGETEVVEPEPFTLPEDFATQVQGWDIPVEQLPEAVAMFKALQTEDGLIDHFVTAGGKLGFGLKDLNRLFEEETPPAAAAPPAPAAEPLDPERLMTAAEVEAMLNTQREELNQFRAAQEQQVTQARQAQVFSAMDTWFETQGITDQKTKNAIAQAGERHILPGQDSYDPRVALSALEKGKVEYDAWIEAEAQSYLQRKAATKQNLPTNVGGGQTHGGGNEEPPVEYEKLGGKALEAAKARVRERLRQSGELT